MKRGLDKITAGPYTAVPALRLRYPVKGTEGGDSEHPTTDSP